MNQHSQSNPMTNRERDLVLSVSDGNNEALIFIFSIREVCRVGEHLDYFAILSWLRKNRITGLRFITWMKVEHENAVVKAVGDIRTKITNDKKARLVFARGQYGRQ